MGLVVAVIVGIGTAALALRADDQTTEAVGTAADELVAGGVPAVLVRVRDGNGAAGRAHSGATPRSGTGSGSEA